MRYENLNLSKDFGENLSKMEEENRQAIAEIILGSIDNHNVYLSKRKKRNPILFNNNIVPFYNGDPSNFKEAIIKKNNEAAIHSIKSLRYWRSLSPNLGIFNFTFKTCEALSKILDQILINKNHTIDDIIEKVGRNGRWEMLELRKCFERFFTDIHHLDIILLRKKNVPQQRCNVKLLSFCM